MEQQVHEPTIVVRGDVPDEMVTYAREKLLAIVDRLTAPVLEVSLRLEHHDDPARERPYRVEMVVDLDGVPVRAHRNARTAVEAIDRAADAAAPPRRGRDRRPRDSAAPLSRPRELAPWRPAD